MAAPNLTKGYRAAAEISGYSEGQIKHFVAGRRTPEFRRCFQMKLEMAGADANSVIKAKVDALRADEHKWNPKTERFDAFADHRTRLRASQDVTKLLELEPPRAEGFNVGVAIKIETNLGTGETYDPPNVLRPKPAVVDVSRGG